MSTFTVTNNLNGICDGYPGGTFVSYPGTPGYTVIMCLQSFVFTFFIHFFYFLCSENLKK